MHAVKSRARHLAWRGDENDSHLSFIPYANRLGRSTSSGMNLPPSDVEAQKPRRRGFGTIDEATHSETCLPPHGEGKQHPTYNRSSTEPGRVSPIEPVSPHQNGKSSTGTSDTLMTGTTTSTENEKPFKRGILSFRKRDRDAQEQPAEAQHQRSLSRISSRRRSFKKHIPIASQLRAIFWSWPNILLICVPIGIALNYAHVDPVAVFVVNILAIIPLAGTLSYATEEIAMRTGETIGGLLNASFGNATELIVAIIALTQGQIVIVQTSLVGSMLSNLLLVLGMCFAAGGYNRPEQHFNMTVAQTACSLLILAVGSLIIPTVFQQWSAAANDLTQKNVPALSRGTAVILLFVYLCYLFFQLHTHVDTYNAPSEKVQKQSLVRRNTLSDKAVAQGIARVGASNAAVPAGNTNAQNLMPANNSEEDDEGGQEEPSLSWIAALLTLAISTAFIGLCSEFVVDNITYITEEKHVPLEFIGLILLPIVGNAAEHATAVTVAIKDKMDLAIGVAVGSSLQIALLVLPLTVMIGWGVGEVFNQETHCSQGVLTLEFDGFVIAVLFVAVLLVNYLIQDGKSHWLEGVMLMTTYVTIAVACWFYPDTTPCLTQGQ